ncbi:MAG: ABC transporter ATP-binding protein [Planctomycetota bacterium]
MTQTAATTAATQGGEAPRPVIACQGLTKIFRDFWLRPRAHAVGDLTFDVRPHEVFGLLGPNGSGKSTTIKIILGLLKPTRGRVAVFGRPPTDVAIKKRIGYLPEESYLYPFLNARETLDYYGRLFGLDHRTRQGRIDELLDMVGLSGAQYRQVREYSKGMQRRIGLAQALINDPDLLILDEPTTGLDPIGTRQVKDLILELGRRGKTVLLSSHLLADVEDVVDRMVVLYGGTLRKAGDRDALLESQDKTTIETDALDDATLSEIDEVIRRRTGGAKSVRRVAHPRQRLEELFLSIVEEAQAERLDNAGAAHGGRTAEFLRDAGEPDGGALIDDLVRGAPEPEEPPAPAEAAEPAEPEPVEDVVESLLDEDVRPKEAAEPDEAAEVDMNVIGSLVDDDGDAPKPRES